VKLHLVLSAFREHRGGADPQDGKAACAHTYTSGALPVVDGVVDRNTEMSLRGNIAQQCHGVASLPKIDFQKR